VTYDELLDFVQNRMVLQHVYQPLLLRFLIETGGQATLRQLAVMLLAEDESQVAYYTKRIREMPVKVLMRHGVLSIDKDSVFLTSPESDV